MANNIQSFRQKLEDTGLSQEQIEEALAGVGPIKTGTAFHSAHLKDLAWVVMRALFVQEARQVTLTVKRGEDEHIVIEVVKVEE